MNERESTGKMLLAGMLGILLAVALLYAMVRVVLSSDERTRQQGTQTEVLAQSEYLVEVSKYDDQILEALNGMSALFVEPRLNDEDWLFNLGRCIGKIQRAHLGLMALKPPPEMAEMHAALVAATQDYYDAMDLLADAVAELDFGKMDRATALMKSGDLKMQEATRLLKEALR